jgi:hypothetical protein
MNETYRSFELQTDRSSGSPTTPWVCEARPENAGVALEKIRSIGATQTDAKENAKYQIDAFWKSHGK